MGKYFVELEDIARKDLKAHFKSGNKSVIKKSKKYYWNLVKPLFLEKVNQKN